MNRKSLNMPAQPGDSSINMAIHSAGAGFFKVLRMIQVNIVIPQKFFGLPERVCLSGQSFIMILMDLMKTFLPIWRRLTFAGDSKTEGTK